MSEHDSKQIIRQWDREIDDEIRLAAAGHHSDDGPWKAVVWAALWLFWLGLLVLLVTYAKSLR